MLSRSVTLHTRRRRPMPILGGIVLVSILLVLLLAFMGVMS